MNKARTITGAERAARACFVEVMRWAYVVMEFKQDGHTRQEIADAFDVHLAYIDYLLAFGMADLDEAFDKPDEPWFCTLEEAEIIIGVRERDGTLVEYYRGHLPARPEVW